MATLSVRFVLSHPPVIVSPKYFDWTAPSFASHPAPPFSGVRWHSQSREMTFHYIFSRLSGCDFSPVSALVRFHFFLSVIPQMCHSSAPESPALLPCLSDKIQWSHNNRAPFSLLSQPCAKELAPWGAMGKLSSGDRDEMSKGSR